MSEFETDNYILQVAHRDGYKLGELARNMKDGRWLLKQNFCDTFENLMGKDAMLPTPISSNKKFHFFTLFMKLENPNDDLVYQSFPGYDNLLSTGQIIDPAKSSGLPDKALPKTDVIAYTPTQVVWNDYESVSYTHLTLPTKRIV